uniref:TNFR-Cys domain-containing protein n=1 Tax=Strongyloides venezuelensis TaxID=75913 RepID=A0A0K0F0E5_STRVS
MNRDIDVLRSHKYEHDEEYFPHRERSQSLAERLNGIIGPTLRTDEEIEEYDEDGKHVIRKVETVEKLVYLPAANNTISRENINYSSTHEKKIASHGEEEYGRHIRRYNDSYRRRHGSFSGNYDQSKIDYYGGVYHNQAYSDNEYISDTYKKTDKYSSKYSKKNTIDKKYHSRYHIEDDGDSTDYGFKEDQIHARKLPSYDEHMSSRKKINIHDEETNIIYKKTRREELRDKCYVLCSSCWCIIIWIICLILLLLSIFLLLWFLVINKSSSSSSSTSPTTPTGVPIINVTTNDIPISSGQDVDYYGVQKDMLQSGYIYVFDTILASVTVLNSNTLQIVSTITTSFATISTNQCQECRIYYLMKECITQGHCMDSDSIYCCNKCTSGKGSFSLKYIKNCNIQNTQTRDWDYRNIQFSGSSDSYLFSLVSINPDYTQDSNISKSSANMEYHTFNGNFGVINDSSKNSSCTFKTPSGLIFDTITVAPSKIGSQDFVWLASINSSSLVLNYFDNLLLYIPVSEVSKNMIIQLTNLPPLNSNILQLTYIDMTNNKLLIRRYQQTEIVLTMNQDFYQMYTPNGSFRHLDYSLDVNGNIYQLSSNNHNLYNVRIFMIN